MHVQPRAALISLALPALLLACSEPAGPHLTPVERTPALAKKLPSGSEPLQVAVEYAIREVTDQSIREQVEISAFFAGVDPIDPETGVPMENLRLSFRTIVQDYTEQPEDRTMEGRVSAAWDISKQGDGFEFSATDQQTVLEAVQLQTFESGQLVGDVTEFIAEAHGKLIFHSNAKLWELRLGLRGVVTPSEIVTPTMLKTISGAVSASLHINQTELTTAIRENEVSFQSAQMVLEAETKIQDEGPDSQREVFAVLASFASGELQVGLPPVFEDLTLDFEINIAGAVGPPCIRFILDGEAWAPGDGGGIQGQEWRAEHLTMLLVQDGQVVADLTNRIDKLEAHLRYRESLKSWELTLEIAGIVTPSDIAPSVFAPVAGARTAALEVGDALEQLGARQLGSEAVF